MANTVALPVDKKGPDEIAVRFGRLNLPDKPLVMEKHVKECYYQHPTSQCYCYEYMTMLERDEYAGKYRQESPVPEARTPRITNGATPVVAKKKIKLDQYLANGRNASTPKPEQHSKENSPASNNATNATNATSRSAPASSTHLPPKPPASALNSSNPITNGSTSFLKPPKSTIANKRPVDGSSDASKPAPKMSVSDASRPAKRQRISPPPPIRHPLPPPPPPSRRSPPPPPPPVPSSRIRSPNPPPRERRTPPRRTATPTPLPALLSPTLPKAIEDALAAEENLDDDIIENPNHKNGASNGIGKALPKAIKKPPALSNGTPSGRSPHPIASPGKTLPKKPGLGSTASKTTGKRALSPTASPRPSSKTLSTSSKHPPASSTTQKTRIVKLRFKKRLRDYLALVKVSTNRRPRISQDENGSARSRSSGSLNVSRPTNARSPAFKSPAIKAPPRERDIVTPPPKKSNGLNVSKKPETAAVTPASKEEKSNAARGNQLAVQFCADYEKFSQVGKSAKHEADLVFRAQMAESKELKKALLVALDSTLCFILSFALHDRMRQVEGNAPQTGMWRSFLPLSGFVADKAKAMNALTLLGFCKQMEAVVRQHLFDIDMIAFHKTSVPENSSKAPTPDSSNTAPPNDRSKYLNLKSRIVQDSRDLKACWIEGMKYLTYDEVQRNFPATFMARSIRWIDPQTDFPKTIGRYKHAFMLPLHRNTTPFEALNFGRRFLEEWARDNNIAFQSRLKDVL